ncbi:hypothetical protein [Streptomyces sp. ICBB 8177]|uniref:hypothetical protein n=1 Tax=Streptomyces sp. ICBB 8177 TaxID=563922 RepID=UPI000D68381F|nr:hypothetical protein [Streptomyces sp. ICBB 8177]PWI43499.1 hypothetical protein CK485_15320 [Streptomyces sp. ICBB 8177]
MSTIGDARGTQGADRAASAEAHLADALRTGPFPLALRAALAARGLALHRVRHRLELRGIHVGVTSLSYWQRGVRRPDRPESLRAVTALEEVLDLPPHSLTRLLGPRTPDARPQARPYRAVLEAAAVVESLLAELEAPPDGGLHTVMQYEYVRIGAHRELSHRRSQHVVRAHRDGVDRYLAIHLGDPGGDVERVRVRATDNCRVGRVRRHPDSCVVVTELLFDGRLRSGDTALLGYEVDDGSGGPSVEYVRGFTFGGGGYALQVGFDAEALPVRCRRFTRSSPDGPRRDVAELTLNGHRTVHLVQPEVRPGVLGITWEWD